MVDKDILLDDLKRVGRIVDGVPSANDYREHGNHSVSAFYRDFDSFTAAREAAGIDGKVRIGPSKKELLADLRRVHEQVSGTVSTDDYHELGTHGCNTLIDRFGGIPEARKAAGIEGDPNSEPRIPDAELLEDIRSVAETIEEPPSEEQYQQHGKHGLNTLRRRFGSFTTARETAGFDDLDKRQEYAPVSEEELLTAIRDLADELGRPPKRKEMANQGRHGTKTYYKRFGSWNNALREVGLDPPYRRDGHRQEFVCSNCGEIIEKRPGQVPENQAHVYCDTSCRTEHFKHRYSGEGNPNWDGGKIQVECANCGADLERKPALAKQHDRFFCDQSSCRSEWRAENIVGEAHPRYKHGGEDFYYGPNFLSQRRKRLEIDDYQCFCCGLTNEESKEKYGAELSAHHIIPVAKFYDEADGDEPDFEEMNALDNLRMMCTDCHRNWEGVPVVPQRET